MSQSCSSWIFWELVEEALLLALYFLVISEPRNDSSFREQGKMTSKGCLKSKLGSNDPSSKHRLSTGSSQEPGGFSAVGALLLLQSLLNTVLFSQQCLSRWPLLGKAYAVDTHSDIPPWDGWSELGLVPNIGFKASPRPCMATPHTCGVWGFMLLPSSGSCGERKHMTLTESLLLPCQHPDLPGLGQGGGGSIQVKGS